MSQQRGRRNHLERSFDRLNRKLFEGLLPSYSVRSATDLSSSYHCLGLCDVERRVILVQRGIGTRSEHRVLLHEMCHAAVPHHRTHDGPFIRQLRRLWSRGEHWAAAEIRRYAPGSWLGLIDKLHQLDNDWHGASTVAYRRRILERAERVLSQLETPERSAPRGRR